MFDNAAIPTEIVVVLAVAAILVLALIVRGPRGARSKRQSDESVIALQTERDTLRASHAVEIATLQKKLDEAAARAHAHAHADATLRVKELERALEAANTEAARHAKDAAALSEAADQTALAEPADADPEELRAVREEAAALRRQLAEREAIIETLRAAPDDGAAPAELHEAKRDAEARAAEANEALSRMAYEIEGLKEKAAAAERAASAANAQLERREAVIELRDDRILALEAELNERTDEPGPLKAALDAARAENVAIQAEIGALRARAGDAEGPPDPALTAELEALRARNARLEEAARAAAALTEADVETLRAELKRLAERFVEDTIVKTEAGEPTLADRIRAYRAAKVGAD